jgi:N-acetylglucosamine repressor
MNLEDVQEMNRAVVLRLLRRNKVWSRAELAHATGLKQATMSNIINDFIRWGLVIETGIMEGKKGRRSIGISLNHEDFRVIGVRVERHYIKFGLFDLLGSPERIERQALGPQVGGESIVAMIIEGIKSMTVQFPRYKVLSAGVAIPGPYLKAEGRMAWVTELPGLDVVPLEARLSSALTIPVFPEHDAAAAALAKWWLSPKHEENETVVYLTVGQGVGAGIVLDGNLLRGASGIAGEIGHLTIDFNGPRCECGNRGCLELYCSSIALLRSVRNGGPEGPALQSPEELTLDMVREAFQKGEPWATAAVKSSARHLGIGLVNVINAYGPGRIIIGDEMSCFGEGYLDAVKSAVVERVNPRVWKSLRIELEPSDSDEILAGVGALAVGHILRRGFQG